MNWDPEIDTPATLAVIGGGPMGVEAALYARFLGYSVLLFVQTRIGKRAAVWGDRLMQAPARDIVSSLGLAALEAQGEPCAFAASDAPISYRQYVDDYLLPVAKSDLLFESVQINSRVASISRPGCNRNFAIPAEQRAELEFRVHVDSRQRGEYTQLVDIILDCSGIGSARQGMAAGGGLAVGETSCKEKIVRGKRDILGNDRKLYAGKHTLLFGNSWEACGNAIELRELASQVDRTRLTWVVPKRLSTSGFVLEPACGEMAPVVEQAHGLLSTDDQATCVPMSAWGIDAIAPQEDAGWNVRLQVGEEETLDIACDQFINCASSTIDWSFAQPLEELRHPASIDVSSGLSAEPHYYLLGPKSIGVRREFTIGEGLEQIRRAFGLIGGRAELDLYATVKPQGAG